MLFVYQSSIIYLILDLIYWMVTIFIFDANHQLILASFYCYLVGIITWYPIVIVPVLTSKHGGYYTLGRIHEVYQLVVKVTFYQWRQQIKRHRFLSSQLNCVFTLQTTGVFSNFPCHRIHQKEMKAEKHEKCEELPRSRVQTHFRFYMEHSSYEDWMGRSKQ